MIKPFDAAMQCFPLHFGSSFWRANNNGIDFLKESVQSTGLSKVDDTI